MIISSSQLDDFLDCPRRWWFKKVEKVPFIDKFDYFTFGSVLHACIERWMAGDKNGRVPGEQPKQTQLPDYTVHSVNITGPLAGQKPGDPVNVFPEAGLHNRDWTTLDNGKSVTPNEAHLIKKLFAEAVEKGIIQRDEHTRVEREINLPVLEGVELTGFLDIFKPGETLDHFSNGPDGKIKSEQIGVLSAPEIHDHKSFSESSIRYLKQPGPDKPIDEPYQKDDGTSLNCVGHNQQLLTYAAATSIIDGYDGPVVVRHNQFPKFIGKVRTVEATVSAKRLKTHWAFVQDTARKMQVVAKIKKWTDTPGPESLDSCSRYGGCPFVPICGKKETLEAYRSMVTKQLDTLAGAAAKPRLNLPIESRKPHNKGHTETMPKIDIFERARQQAAARTQAVPAVVAEAAAAPAKPVGSSLQPKPSPVAINSPAKAPAPTLPPVENGAPWGNPECPVPSCRGLGVNSKGRACPICDKTAEKRGKPTSEMYEIGGSPGGHTATARPDFAEALAEMGAPLKWVQGAIQSVAPEEQAEVGEEVEEDVAAVGEPARLPGRPKGTTKPKAADEPDGRGRRRVGMTLLLGCTQMKGPERPVIMAQELLERVGKELAADMSPPGTVSVSYWELDPNKRKDRIRQMGEVLTEGLQRHIVVWPGGTNDFDLIALFNALEPYAEAVYGGMR